MILILFLNFGLLEPRVPPNVIVRGIRFEGTTLGRRNAVADL